MTQLGTMEISDYVQEIWRIRSERDATEHSYRPILEELFGSYDENVEALNEARAVSGVGAPDFTFKRKDKTGGQRIIGHCEAKDVGKLGLDARGRITFGSDARSKTQFEKYLAAFDNLLYTDGLTFIFFRDGKPDPVAHVTVAEELMGLDTRPEEFDRLNALLADFVAQAPVSIGSARELASRMARKAQLIRYVFENALRADDPDFRTELGGHYKAFKRELIHDITPESFASLYAETITYGLFAARLNDDTPNNFSREEAARLLPPSNPFLRKLFQFVAGPDLDAGIQVVVDDLVDILMAADLGTIMKGYGRSDARNDPFLHFYEDFLAGFDKDRRKARGVWYTPEPVVDFIVRAVDEVLKTEFGLADGLADTSKTIIQVKQQKGRTKGGTLEKKTPMLEKEVHRVQILDPATGTGTFLARTLKHIAATVKPAVGEAGWSAYVNEHLIPRLHGFELLMAPYAMAHLKLGMELEATGYRSSGNEMPRLSVWLTNSLEEGEQKQVELPFAHWLADEVREANAVKAETPIMVVLGNPPYLGEGGVSEGWIGDLMTAYKQEPGGGPLQERNSKWLNDLYVKFIRMAEATIAETGEGVVAMITNHGWLDNPTFRGMRWHLLQTFDTLHVLDLHGNSKKKEKAPDGGADANVFDIEQGVAILVAVKRKGGKKKDKLARIRRADLWGARKGKYEALHAGTLKTGFVWETIAPHPPAYTIVERDWDLAEIYVDSFSVHELFVNKTIGVTTSRDPFYVALNKEELEKRMSLAVEHARGNINARALIDIMDSKSWVLDEAAQEILEYFADTSIKKYNYRAFDHRYVTYEIECLERAREETFANLRAPNLLLSYNRKVDTDRGWHDVLTTALVSDLHALSMKESNYYAPLYLYPQDGSLDQTRRVNFDPALYTRIREAAELGPPTDETAEAVFDYIYGVLHCPAYRETYAEFLKADFPRVPFPDGPEMFEALRAPGHQLRRLHLMEPGAIGETPFPLEGEMPEGEAHNLVAKGYPKQAEGSGDIRINPHQRFTNVPEASWDFWIGGYQPAQKWLKDRRGRALSYDDIRHYQRILKILSETDRIMNTIEMDL